MMRFHCQLPPQVHGDLQAAAHRQGVRADELVSRAVAQMLGDPQAAADNSAIIAERAQLQREIEVMRRQQTAERAAHDAELTSERAKHEAAMKAGHAALDERARQLDEALRSLAERNDEARRRAVMVERGMAVVNEALR